MNANFISPLPAFAVRASNDRKTEQREQFSAFHFQLSTFISSTHYIFFNIRSSTQLTGVAESDVASHVPSPRKAAITVCSIGSCG